MAIRQKRQILAGQSNVRENRFVMCNKDQAICLSVKETQAVEGQDGQASQVNQLEKSNHLSNSLRNDYFGKANVEKSPTSA